MDWGMIGFVIALGVFTFNIIEFRATRKDIAAVHKDIVAMHKDIARSMAEHGKVLKDIRNSLKRK